MRVAERIWLILLAIGALAYPQQTEWDTILVQYQIIHQEYSPFYDVIKIKVPPFLSTAEVMEQVRLLLFFPGTPPPRKETRVYVFRETDPVGAVSKTGCIYKPGKGIFWDMADWRPDSSWVRAPTAREIMIYNIYLDTLFKHSIPPVDSLAPFKKRVAEQFHITPGQLDTIYYRVKLWNEAQKRQQKQW